MKAIVSFLLGLLLGLAACSVVLQRYVFLVGRTAPVIYRCDRLTGRVWISPLPDSTPAIYWTPIHDKFLPPSPSDTADD